MRHRNLLRIPLVLMAAALLAASAMAVGGGSHAAARIGGRPPPFVLPPATNGPSHEPFHMGRYLGHNPVVISFWATWCQPCMQELPYYEQMYQRFRGQGLRVVAVAMDSQATIMNVGPMARRLGVTFDVVTDVDTRLQSQMNTRRAAPFSVWVDRSGRIVRESEGFSPAEVPALTRALEQLVGG